MKFYLFLFLFIFSCSTGGPLKSLLKAPSEPEEWAPPVTEYRPHLALTAEELGKAQFSTKAMERWRKYRWAMNLSEQKNMQAQSCSIFQELAQDDKFILASLAKLRQEWLCNSEEASPTLSLEEKKIYEDLLADKTLKESQKTKSLDDDVPALLEKARLSKHYQEKESLLKEAVAVAQKSQNKNLITQAETALFKNSPRLNPQPQKEDLMSIASNHRLWREFDQALKIYLQLIADPKLDSEEKYNAYKAWRHTLKTAQRRNEYIESTARMAQWSFERWKAAPKDFTNQKRLADSQLLLARTLWTEDRTNEALKTLKRTRRWLSGLYPMDELNFILSRIFEERRDDKAALSYIEAALQERASVKGLKEKMLWTRAWLLYKGQNYGEALKALQTLTSESSESSDKIRSLYWTGRTQLKLSLASEARETFTSLIQEDPLGFYGLLAHREMDQKIPPLGNSLSPSFDHRLASSSLPPHLRTQAALIDWLVAVGETTFAERALNYFSDQASKDKTLQDQNFWLRIFSQYAQSGLYLPLFSNLTQVKAEVREGVLSSHPEILFPQPYKDLVDQAEIKTGVPAALIYAIMRQESAFNPKARSPLDAYGLMQMLPSLARSQAKKNQIPMQADTDLYDPAINIPLGALELQALLKKYRRQLIMTISSYNASEKALRGWLKHRYRTDSVEFIEEIPYEETRAYVKLVLRNYIFYTRLQQAEAFPFPEDSLRLSR